MKKAANAETRRSLLIAFIFLGLIASIAFLPSIFRSGAGNAQQKPEVSSAKLENYDIRTDKSAAETILSFRQTANRDSVMIADARDKFVAGENQLRQSVPTLKIEYNTELGNPGLIGPDVLKGRALLTSPSNAKRPEILRNFLKENNNLVGMTGEQINNLKTTADYTNPNGELSFTSLEQFIDGIPVFRSEIRAGFNKQGAMFRIINNSAPELDYSSLSKDFGNPADAILRASGHLNHTLRETARNDADSTDLKVVFGKGDWATTAEKMYFPTEIGVARPAWRVLIWEIGDAYYVIVDAETGTMLYRENITYDQTQTATYNVYASTTNLLKAMPNPAPLAAPGLINPALGTQGTLQPRSNVTLIGNEAPNTFNNLGWMNDGFNGTNGHTDGNNVAAGVDRDTTNGIDNLVAGTNRVFNFNYTPGAGQTNTGGDDPLTPAYQNGAATNLFYVTNRFHDLTYTLGFTEAAKNFQNDNFGRGGAAADRISAEAQDNTASSSCTPPCFNNANFSTPADGGRGRMQMYLWNAPTPDRDGDLDAEIIVHELTHGVFGRLHSGSISNTQAGQMNEGSADFFAHVMLSNFDEPINTISTTGAYSTLLLRSATFTSNYYYGIRRFPKAVFAFTGGPNNRPHNPLTFADIDPARINVTDGAFAPAFTGSATAVHDGGEIWSSMMWEVRAKLVQRLGAEAGNRKVLQLAMDGMKMSPSGPSMIQERNAIIAAAQANGNGADVADIWAGFAVRGMGFSATNTTGNTVTEGFDLPNAVLASNGFAVSDAAPGGDGDGFPEPGETVQLTVPVTNETGNTVNNVVATVTGGGNASYGSLTNGQTATRQISYLVPANAVCGGLHAVTITVSSDLGSQPAQTRSFRLGAPVGGAPATFSNTTAITIADNAPASVYPSNITVSGLTGNKTIKLNLNGLSHTFPGDTDFLLVGPGGQKFLAMSDMGGGGDVANINLTLSDNAATALSTSQLVTGEFKPGNTDTTTDVFPAPAPAAPYNSPAPAGTATFASTFGSDGSAMNGTWALYIRDDANTDFGQLAGGWSLTFEANDYSCSIVTASRARADFDGDGKTDISVFRPSEGKWYMNQSTDGSKSTQWGTNGDKLMPGDFDGDGKTDFAVARNNSGNTARTFFILNSSDSTSKAIQWGEQTDIPSIGDFNGDGKADISVFRPSNGVWYISYSNGTTSFVALGASGDIPVAHDYNGDGTTEVAVYRPSTNTWFTSTNPATNYGAVQFGAAGDKLVPADYDGDSKIDIAVYRPSNGVWYILRSRDGFTGVQFGASTDVPVPGDYDGDGKTDVAVYRGGTWFINRSNAGMTAVNFGASSDAPVPNHYLP